MPTPSVFGLMKRKWKERNILDLCLCVSRTWLSQTPLPPLGMNLSQGILPSPSPETRALPMIANSFLPILYLIWSYCLWTAQFLFPILDLGQRCPLSKISSLPFLQGSHLFFSFSGQEPNSSTHLYNFTLQIFSPQPLSFGLTFSFLSLSLQFWVRSAACVQQGTLSSSLESKGKSGGNAFRVARFCYCNLKIKVARLLMVLFLCLDYSKDWHLHLLPIGSWMLFKILFTYRL